MQVQGETDKEPVTGPVKRGAALLVTTLSSFLTPFMAASVTVALPSIQREFNMDALLLNWVATSFLLAAAVFLLPVGMAGNNPAILIFASMSTENEDSSP